MQKEEAAKLLMIGYIIAAITFIIALFFAKGEFTNKLGIACLATYCIWGTFWGMKITSGFVSSLFFGQNIFYTNIWDVIKGRYIIQFWFYISLFASGYVVGVLGGGLYKQIKLMTIAYS